MKTYLGQQALRAAIHKATGRLGLTSRGIRDDEDGIAAMEFAILAPLIIFTYLCLAEISVLMATDRQVGHSASVAGDMVAQVTTLDEEDMADIISSAISVASVKDPSQYVIQITSYEMDDNDDIEIVGQATYGEGNAGKLNSIDPSTFGTELLAEGSGVVVANVAHTQRLMGEKGVAEYKGGELLFGITEMTLRETFMLKPRRSEAVIFGDDGAKFNCTGMTPNIVCTIIEENDPDDDSDDSED